MIMTAQIDENLTELIFKGYFESLEDEKKNELIYTLVPKYISISSFYRKKNDNSFSELEFEKLELLTGQKFQRNETATN